MVTFREADGTALNYKASEKLNGVLEKPEWAGYVKTGHHKDSLPQDDNWWFVRGAAILRTVALKGPIGVSKLRQKYGGKKNRGHKPEHKYRAGGKIIRTILQQLTKSGLIKDTEKGARKGKVLTGKGESFLNGVAKDL